MMIHHPPSIKREPLKTASASQRGVSLYLAILIMGILLAMVLGLSTLSFLQVKTIRGMTDSVGAFYAANTGIEWALHQFFKEGEDLTLLCPQANPCEDDLTPDSRYMVIGLSPGGDCLASNYCIESVGTKRATRRALRISF